MIVGVPCYYWPPFALSFDAPPCPKGGLLAPRVALESAGTPLVHLIAREEGLPLLLTLSTPLIAQDGNQRHESVDSKIGQFFVAMSSLYEEGSS